MSDTLAAPANHASSPAASGTVLDAEILIVGTGFAGIGMGVKLREAGITSFLILERANDVGGTWRDNDYPGCACDVPSRLYSFSFHRKTDWSRVYPTQPEIWSYLREVVKKYALRPHIRFDSEMTDAVWNETTSTWHVSTKDGRRLVVRTLISGMGGLSNPSFPNLKGLDRFAGPAFHSARWRHDVDLAGKTVAVIGTGASAIQFVPAIQPIAKQITLFQRTPPWVLPKPDAAVGARKQFLLRVVPGYAWTRRKIQYWAQEARALGFVVNPKLLRILKLAGRWNIARGIADPATREKVTPDYEVGCKRILVSNDYYRALGSPNVHVETTEIAEVREHSLVTRDAREFPADVIVFGTGFKATEPIAPARIVGRGGVELLAQWREGAEAYLGITVTNFPNLFLIVGPNTGLGHTSMILMIESQIRYIVSALAHQKSRGGGAIEVRAGAQRAFADELAAKMEKTVWSTGCKSWYIDKSGKNTTLWPDFTFTYMRRTKAIAPADYEVRDSLS